VDTQTKPRQPSFENARQPGGDSGQDREVPSESHPSQKPSWLDRLRQHWMLATVAACVVVVALIAGLLYWLDIRHYESTDDAFVAARSFSIAPNVGRLRR
jgi:membrane fusion protein, multidrug efflux system